MPKYSNFIILCPKHRIKCPEFQDLALVDYLGSPGFHYYQKGGVKLATLVTRFSQRNHPLEIIPHKGCPKRRKEGEILTKKIKPSPPVPADSKQQLKAQKPDMSQNELPTLSVNENSCKKDHSDEQKRIRCLEQMYRCQQKQIQEQIREFKEFKVNISEELKEIKLWAQEQIIESQEMNRLNQQYINRVQKNNDFNSTYNRHIINFIDKIESKQQNKKQKPIFQSLRRSSCFSHH